MAKIIYIERSGKTHTVDVKEGHSVMEGAVSNSIPGITADCGGACSCATCHVYVDAEWKEKIAPMSPLEESLLEFSEGVQDNSRLSCQITVTKELDGLTVRIPQHH